MIINNTSQVQHGENLDISSICSNEIGRAPAHTIQIMYTNLRMYTCVQINFRMYTKFEC
jgi:hypothetical protein